MKSSTIRLFCIAFFAASISRSLNAQSNVPTTTDDSSSTGLSYSDILPDSLETQLETLPDSAQDLLNQVLEQFKAAREQQSSTGVTNDTVIQDINAQAGVIDALLDPVVSHDDVSSTGEAVL